MIFGEKAEVRRWKTEDFTSDFQLYFISPCLANSEGIYIYLCAKFKQ